MNKTKRTQFGKRATTRRRRKGAYGKHLGKNQPSFKRTQRNHGHIGRSRRMGGMFMTTVRDARAAARASPHVSARARVRARAFPRVSARAAAEAMANRARAARAARAAAPLAVDVNADYDTQALPTFSPSSPAFSPTSPSYSRTPPPNPYVYRPFDSYSDDSDYDLKKMKSKKTMTKTNKMKKKPRRMNRDDSDAAAARDSDDDSDYDYGQMSSKNTKETVKPQLNRDEKYTHIHDRDNSDSDYGL